MLFCKIITVIIGIFIWLYWSHRAFCAIQQDVLCYPANVRQLNSKVMARNKLSIRFSYMLDTAQDNARDTIRYMPIRGRDNCLREVVCFLCTKLGTYDWISRCNDTNVKCMKARIIARRSANCNHCDIWRKGYNYCNYTNYCD